MQLNKLWQWAIVTSVVTCTAAFLLLYVLGILSTQKISYLALCFIVCSAVMYFIVQSVIRIFVFRKVKPLYKIISSAKLGAIKRDQNNRNDILERVEDDVRNWVKDTQAEMETMQSLEKYRKDYIGNISHELKTPIFNIQGYLHSLLDGAMYEKKYLKSFLQKAANNVERLNTIVQDLDLISKIESGTITLVQEKFNLNELVTEVIEDTQDVAGTKKIEVFIKEGTNKSYKVMGDRNAIRQVLTNLITNSVKYGKIDGSTRIGFYDMDKYLLVEVTDDGVGIAKEHLPHLFDRFYRVEKSRVRGEGGVAGGSGLGLSIVKHLIEAHDQTISVRSTPSLGSTFSFTMEKAK